MTDRTRREFLRCAAGCAVAVPFIGTAFAADLPKVELTDPTAQALKYTHDASTVDVATRGGERKCAGCNFYTAGADAEWGPCTLFPGKSVAGAGWCSGWVARAG